MKSEYTVYKNGEEIGIFYKAKDVGQVIKASQTSIYDALKVDGMVRGYKIIRKDLEEPLTDYMKKLLRKCVRDGLTNRQIHKLMSERYPGYNVPRVTNYLVRFGEIFLQEMETEEIIRVERTTVNPKNKKLQPMFTMHGYTYAWRVSPERLR